MNNAVLLSMLLNILQYAVNATVCVSFRLMNSTRSDEELKAKIKSYLKEGGKESPPPPPPMKKTAVSSRKSSFDNVGPSTSRHAASVVGFGGAQPPPAPKFLGQKKHPEPAPKLSFQIKKRPLQMDKLGMLRLAAPAEPLKGGRSSSSRMQPNENLSLMSYLRAGFPEEESAAELRQKQASQWAFR